jgi:hypothetical protein
MLRQHELFRVLGRRLTARLLAAGWIVPVRQSRAIYFNECAVHRAFEATRKGRRRAEWTLT